MYFMMGWKPTVQCIASFMVSLWSACVRTFNNFTMGLIVVPCVEEGEGRRPTKETHTLPQSDLVCVVFAPHDLWTTCKSRGHTKTCSQLGMRLCLYPSLKHMQLYSYSITQWVCMVTTMWVWIPSKASLKKVTTYITYISGELCSAGLCVVLLA